MRLPDLIWPSPPADRALPENEIHVWAFSLDQGDPIITDFAKDLSAEESHRASRFRFAQDRTRFAVGRGALRKILGSYLKAHPREIAFRYGKNGKPELLQPHQSPTLHFNLAHSADLAVLAVASFGPVGVDIERVRPIGELDGIAAQFFSQDEKDGLAALPDEERQAAFYRLWTRKEAFLKATGEGIADSLAEVEINFSPTEPARLLRLFGDTVTARHWTILELDPAPNFIGALAVQARDLQIKRWRWIEP